VRDASAEMGFIRFALSYGGYALWVDLADFANDAADRWRESGALPEGLDSMRACLFFEQRRYRHFDRAPQGQEADYVWALIDAIREACPDKRR
jgi:hypothetical protein